MLQFNSASSEDLSRTLALLEKLVGPHRIGCPVPVDTHRPDAFRLAPLDADKGEGASWQVGEKANRELRLVLRRLRPPRPIQISSQEIVYCAGPWRSSGDWWESGDVQATWARDEWDVELTDGRICRVFWDPRAGKWFLEGTYD